MENNIPQLRFSEFKGEWKEKPFGNIAERSKEKYNPETDDNNFKCIELESLGQNTGTLLKTFNSKELKSIKTKFYVGEVLFGKLRPYLRKYYYTNFDGVCTSEIWVLKGINTENLYLLYLIQTVKFNHQVNLTTGSKMPRADWSILSKSKFVIPNSLPEQTKIATFLTAVDKRINLLQKKKAELEDYKKGVMQKLFSQTLRFKDDDGNDFPDWEEKRLGEIGFFQTSSVDKLTKEGEKSIFLVNYLNVYNHEEINSKTVKEYQIVSAKDSQIKSSNLKKGDILFTPSSETASDIGHSVVIFEDIENAVYSYHLMRFRPNVDLDLRYSHYFCNNLSVLKQMSRFSTGSTRYTISVGNFSKVIVSIPTKPEQTQIANYLTALDNKIDASVDFKKGLLQQLFV